MKIRNVFVPGYSNSIKPLLRRTLVQHTIALHYRPIYLNAPENYLPGGEVLKLQRIKSLKKKAIKALSSFIVKKLYRFDF